MSDTSNPRRRTKAQIEADKAAAPAAGKPKRTRRTMAQIEADKAAEASMGTRLPRTAQDPQNQTPRPR